MATANKFRGRAGRLMVTSATSVAAADLGSLRNWALNVTMTPINASDADSSGWDEHLDGQKTWNMTASAVYLSTGATSKQDELRTAVLAGSTKYFVLHTSTASDGTEFAGWGHVTNFNPSGEYENVALVDFEIMGTGSLSESS